MRLYQYIRKHHLFYFLLFFPLVVFYLPRFYSTYEEDLLLLALFVYLLLRILNEKRINFRLDHQPLVTALLLSVVYIIGWMGYLRGYLDSTGRLLAWYPLLLGTLFFLRPAHNKNRSQSIKFAMSVLIVAMALLFISILILNILSWVIGFTLDIDTGILIPSLMIFPILGCILLISDRFPPLNSGKNHLLLFLILTIPTFSVWYQNAKTWALWYQAGEQERAWTPFKYEPAIHPEELAAAENKPYDAIYSYQSVLTRIQHKGDIPRYLNWPFFMRYRMACQAMRKENPALCLQVLPVNTLVQSSKISLVKELWHLEFLWDIQESEPRYDDQNGIWMDFEYHSEQNKAYILDRWGRVYSYFDDKLWCEWSPGTIFNDAIDLECYKDVFIVLRSSGRLITSGQVDFLGNAELFTNKNIIDMEIYNDQALILADSQGGYQIVGDSEIALPNYNSLYFNRPVIADMEIDVDGKGYYLLDIYGAVHSNHSLDSPSIPHTSPPVPSGLSPYWANQRMAIDLELDPLNRGIYVYNRLGEIFTIAVKPFRETYRPSKTYPYRGVGLEVTPKGDLLLLESNGQKVLIDNSTK